MSMSSSTAMVGSTKQLTSPAIGNDATARLEFRKSLQASVPYVVRWINSLKLPLNNVTLRMKAGEKQAKVTPYNFFEALQNGLLLIEIHEATCHDPDQALVIRGVNKRPKTQAIMLKNLDIALRYMWSRSARATYMCTPLDFYHGNMTKILPCVLEMMQVWVFKKNRGMACRYLVELNSMLAPFYRDFLTVDWEDYDLDECLVADFADGTNLAIVLTVLGLVKESDLIPKMYGRPKSQAEFAFNYKLVLFFLKKLMPDM
ncbi:unnamed protein product, partial [Amoebophrya sp. A25]|eukprot:GSA25T00007569001.1